MTRADVFEASDADLPNLGSASAALSKLFTEHMLVERKHVQGKNGKTAGAYRLTEAGVAEVERHRPPSYAQGR